MELELRQPDQWLDVCSGSQTGHASYGCTFLLTPGPSHTWSCGHVEKLEAKMPTEEERSPDAAEEAKAGDLPPPPDLQPSAADDRGATKNEDEPKDLGEADKEKRTGSNEDVKKSRRSRSRSRDRKKRSKSRSRSRDRRRGKRSSRSRSRDRRRRRSSSRDRRRSRSRDNRRRSRSRDNRRRYKSRSRSRDGRRGRR